MNVLCKKSNYDTTKHWWYHFGGQCSITQKQNVTHRQMKVNIHIGWAFRRP